MATTPEGKVKKAVSAMLQRYQNLHYDMPVPGGYGGTTLDYVCCFFGVYFAIETKAPGKSPTPRQKQIIASMERAGARVFVIDGATSEHLAALDRFLEVTQLHGNIAAVSRKLSGEG